MRYSKLFGKTTKTISKDIVMKSHQLLTKAGYVAESTAGRYFFLPLGMRVHDKVMKVIEEEMDKAGAQKMISPVLHPLELWKETSRTKTTGFELMKIKDRRGADFALGGTAEEMFVDVVRKHGISYKDLPMNLYQFSTKFRDELRARGGLLRVREFVMKDAYSFHTDEEDFKKEYKNMWDTYSRIFKRLGLDTVVVESDNGYIGGEYCHEFVVISEIGESRFLTTEGGGYAAHEDVAKFKKEKMNLDEKEEEMVEVDAKRGPTMEDGVNLHKKPLWQQIKDVLFVDEGGRFVLALIRGDLDVNETKLKHIVDVVDLRHATDEEIRDILHSEPGFISPVGIKDLIHKNKKLVIVADDSLRTAKNFYGGANKKYKDLFNVNIDRDFKVDLEGDIAMAEEGHMSLDGKKLVAKKGIEVGNIFQLGYHYSSRMKDAIFTDKDGSLKQFYMGCYGIGLGRTMAAIVEVLSDDKGIVWPKEIAPYSIHLITLRSDDEAYKKGEELYNKLMESGVEVLWDDRDEVSPGEKFADADLIGVPVRVVVSEKALKAGGVEVKDRETGEIKVVSEGGLEEILK